MTGNKALQVQNRKSLILLSGRAYPELAERIAAELGVALMATSAYDFANGEIYVRFQESLRGCDARGGVTRVHPHQLLALRNLVAHTHEEPLHHTGSGGMRLEVNQGLDLAIVDRFVLNEAGKITFRIKLEVSFKMRPAHPPS